LQKQATFEEIFLPNHDETARSLQTYCIRIVSIVYLFGPLRSRIVGWAKSPDVLSRSGIASRDFAHAAFARIDAWEKSPARPDPAESSVQAILPTLGFGRPIDSLVKQPVAGGRIAKIGTPVTLMFSRLLL
jgi:hypothetical protein